LNPKRPDCGGKARTAQILVKWTLRADRGKLGLELAMSRIRIYRLLEANDCRSWDSENLDLKMAFVLKKYIYVFIQVRGR